MKTVGSLPHSQEPATHPYSEPDQSCPCSPSQFPKIHFNIILQSTHGFPSGRFHSAFPTKTLFHAPRLRRMRVKITKRILASIAVCA